MYCKLKEANNLPLVDERQNPIKIRHQYSFECYTMNPFPNTSPPFCISSKDSTRGERKIEA